MTLLTEPWAGPLGGVPPFDRATVADLEPALDAGMADYAAEIAAIAGDPAPPTFDNTIVALERSGRPLDRVEAVYGVFASNLASPEFRAIEARMAPRLSGFYDAITHDAALFARVDAVYRGDQSALTDEQKRLVWRTWNGFARYGARLDAVGKARLSAINAELSELQTRFAQNVLADEENLALLLDDPARLAGVPAVTVAAFAADAQAYGLTGWRVSAMRSAMEVFLSTARDRDARARAFAIWTSRGDTGGETDNNAIAARIVALRAEKATVLGYESYAHWKLEGTMAATPDAALALSMRMWRPAVEQVRRDVAAMQAIVDAERGGFAIAPHDYRFYAEKLRRARYDLDMDAVKPYLRLDRVREAMFAVAGRLYGLGFAEAADVPVFHPEVRVWSVTRADGRAAGLWYFDPYARPGKSSGAWMTSYRVQSRFSGERLPLVSNNANFVKPPEGADTTIGFMDAVTMFHEFGHALHALLSDVTYPKLAGTSVARDFVEFPSQFTEHYLTTPAILATLTNADGEPLPVALAERIRAAATFNRGFAVVETQASAIADMRMHLAGTLDPVTFERDLLADLGMPAEIVMRHRIPHFGHVFAGDGYAAGYYGYLWAEVLDQDAWAAFAEIGDPFDDATARRLRDTLLVVGDTVDPAEAYRRFRGRDPDIAPLLAANGFVEAA